MTAQSEAADFYDLGPYSRPADTNTALAQRWFDQGLNWRYGFNHEAAIRAFTRAAAIDPRCAMAHWGIAWANGPFYNRAWADYPEDELRDAVAAAHCHVERARALAPDVRAADAALIDALASAFPQPQPAALATMQGWHDAYVAKMRDVHARFCDDLDVAALFAEAMMNRTPWALWDTATGKPAANADTEEVLDVLTNARACAERCGIVHPAIDHLLVHALETSPSPGVATAAANRLRDLAPDAGHLLHMPSHIDVQVGRYEEALAASEKAIAADRRFLAREGARNFFTSSRCHNLHLKIYAAMLAARWGDAISAADELADNLPEDLLRWAKPPLSHWLEGYVPMRLHVLIRFGKWEELIATPLPDDRDLYCTTVPLTHYARGVAHAALGHVLEAEAEQRGFRAAAARVPGDRMFFTNPSHCILAVAEAMLEGEIAYRRGEHDYAFDQLRLAISRDDQLPYDEPWGWMQPVRHALGALLLEQNQVEEAAAVYRADLGLDDGAPRTSRHPDNPWALQGLAECLSRLGDSEGAAAIMPRLEQARRFADIDLDVSCFCRRAVPTQPCCASTSGPAR